MEKLLQKLFEYQKFEENGRLSALIAETEERFGAELSDDDLESLAAAGDPYCDDRDEKKNARCKMKLQ